MQPAEREDSGGVTYVAALRRKAGTSREEFAAAWLGQHRRLARGLPHIESVEFMPVSADAGIDSGFDGVGLLRFASLELLQESLRSERAAELRADTSRFADESSVIRMVLTTTPREPGTAPRMMGEA